MRQGTTLFVQMILKIPKSMVQIAIDEFRADLRSRVLTARDHLYILRSTRAEATQSRRHEFFRQDAHPPALRGRSFRGRFQNAVLIQLSVALLASALVSWIQLTIRTGWTRLRTLRYIRTRLLQMATEEIWHHCVQPAD